MEKGEWTKKSELAAFDRKIQLELAPLTQENGHGQTDNDENEKMNVEGDREYQAENINHNHIVVVKSLQTEKSKIQSKRMKI